MHNIIICGDCGERGLTRTITSACKNYGGVISADGGRIMQSADSTDFLILNVNTLTEIECKGLLIFGEALCQVPSDIRIGNVIPIADCGNQDAVRLLHSSGKAVIGCSMSGRDTVTLSSKTDSGGLICIRRTLRTLGGQMIEPCEIQVKCDRNTEAFPILAACCTLLLCDIPYNEGYVLS